AIQVPYENLTPLQAALSVRQGLRLVIPSGVHPRISKLIQRCWGENPNTRPVFSEITAELEDILQPIQAASSSKGGHRHTKQKIQMKTQR
uniref:Serine-threonine/tyrosine-protein kinase catalytic domain-containing protein n=1 Tax=Aegilops tauschii subsp. strangulata TaxID=200361 RepID=A0A453DJ98_AEGTS